MSKAHALTATALLLAGCAAQPRSAPAVAVPPPPLASQPEPPPPPPAPAAPQGWEDQPLSAGDWRYTPGPPAVAEYGEAAGPRFTLRCDAARGRVLVSRSDAAGPVTIRTTSSVRTFEGPEAALPAADPFLDAIAFSRGRVAVESEGRPVLIVPTWPEPARVVEDCRP